MSSNQIILYIEEDQLAAQKNNNYSLYLAKQVNGSFTVIWKSKGPVATVNTPSYQYRNTFDIATPSFNVNYTNDPVTSGDVTFTSGGKNLPISTGQKTILNPNGIFSPAQNGGVSSDILITNQLQGNPREILLDSNGNNIWVNRQSGMNIGTATLTPLNNYQLWFGNTQATGSLIAVNVSNTYAVTVKDGGSVTLTYTNSGTWITGEPANKLSAKQVEALHSRLGIEEVA
ncbi:hypothetical protein BLL42_15135 [Pseudomonas frederiksbergensis]|uniref:Uncharacterized protein n=1 Tax=Pseudomonas frederiksbergensis TaxID=104087 RepID=A0A1J0ELK1_9PSED|nr:hypothetical protein [Pseudomonas frederiksbergensis]APC17002.1 hypothetical protein BLL42_15135 [Pseudomonas frederiksbergensis]